MCALRRTWGRKHTVLGGTRKGTNGLNSNGVTAFVLFVDRLLYGVLPLTYSYLPKSAGAFLFPNLPEFISFAAAPLVLTPFVRNQITPNLPTEIIPAKISRL